VKNNADLVMNIRKGMNSQEKKRFVESSNVKIQIEAVKNKYEELQ
jgi:hypothetical protein